MMCMAVKEEEEEEEGNWSELPYHVLHEIMDRLCRSFSDYIRCRIVCVSWRSAFKNYYNPCITPLLMVPSYFSTFTSSSSSSEEENSTFTSSSSYSARNNIFDQDTNKKKKKKKKNKNKNNQQLETRRFYNISDEKVDDMLKVIMPRYSQCRGSSHGWLIIVDDVEPFHVIRLFNPFFTSSLMSFSKSKKRFVLPSLKDHFPFKMINPVDKAVLSANPISNPTDYIVMIIYVPRFELAFHKSGDKGWTQIKSPSIKDSRDSYFEDIIYYQHKFFAIHWMGTVVVCDDLATGAAARVLLHPPETKQTKQKSTITKMYLVESSQGDLLQVHRCLYIEKSDERLIYSTIGFRVFKLLLLTLNNQEIATLEHESDYKWVEVKNLCGDTLFLGQNASISINSASKCEDSTECKPNSIYYADDADFYTINPNDSPHDIGIFNLEDGTFERYFSTDLNNTSIRPVPIWPVPIWIQPSLQNE